MMHEFKVWAPKATRMTIVVEDERYAMAGPARDGWWCADVDAPDDAQYAYLIDDDPTPYPDPRAARMPNGVHGMSQLHNQGSYLWHDERWQGPPLTGAVLYEMHVGTFTKRGTFDAAISRLDHLCQLGITHIECMPVAAFPGDFGWGYDGVGLFAVREEYGGPDGLKRFVDACHDRNLAVLLDVVYNHFGPVGSYANKFGPYLTDRHRTPWGDAINFEGPGSDEVRRFFIDNALTWMRDYHIDGLRLDAVHEFVDRSAIHFMEQLSAEVDVLSSTLSRRLVLIAESDLNDPRVVTPREASGYGFDAQWSDDFHHALFTVLHVDEAGKGYYDDFGDFASLAKSLTDIFVYDGEYSTYRNRSHGRPVDRLSAHHFIGFIQNHDQVGNRAVGDRLAQIVGLERTKVAEAIVLTAPFLPMLFQGEEYAASTPFQYFAHHDDEEMAKAVAQGRKTEFSAFGWNPEQIPDPEREETFERSKLNWDEVHQDEHAEMLTWMTRLIHLRRRSPSLNDGDTGHIKVHFSEEDRWLSIRRNLVHVFCNLGDAPHAFADPGCEMVLASQAGVARENGTVTVPPDSVAIFSGERDVVEALRAAGLA